MNKKLNTTSKYISEYQMFGTSIVNVSLICKDWTDKFSICTYINDVTEKYTLSINGKRNNNCKTQISKEQLNEIISKLDLVHVRDSSFRSAGSYHTKSFIKSEIERIKKIEKEKLDELSFIRNIIYNYSAAI